MRTQREYWTDYVKSFACILVVLGHLYQSMVRAEIISDNTLYQWFNTTIYYFHVPLFFICSGYLYNSYSNVDSIKSWKDNAVKKLLVLGIPYFIFSFLTWLMKTVFSGSVNIETGSLTDTLFFHPTSPYWYLYVLFFIFLIVPTINSRIGFYILLGISVALKVVDILGFVQGIYIVSLFCGNMIWFVFGILISIIGVKKIRYRTIGIALGVSFFAFSLFTYELKNGIVQWVMGIIACTAVLMIVNSCKEIKMLTWFSKYTMPIFLMHTIFASSIRIILIKMGINSVVIHLVLGVFMSFIGPILAMIVLSKIKLSWIVYPSNIIKKRFVSKE